MRSLAFVIAGWCCCLSASSQTILKGSFCTGSFSGSNTNQLNAVVNTSTTTFSQSESQSFRIDVGFGKFYKPLKAVEFGIWTGLSHSKGTNSNYWSNAFAVNIGKVHFVPILDNRLWFTLGQKLEYLYGYSRDYSKGSKLPRPQQEQHGIGYQFSPGIFYGIKNKFLLGLTAPFVTAGASTVHYNTGTKRTTYSYNINANVALTSLQFKLIVLLHSPHSKTGL